MGNEVSSALSSTKISTGTRTFISLDDSSCWQLYNGMNDRAEAVSIFLAKQSFSVECRRSIQFLKTIRHPSIIKFLTGFKTFVDHDSFLADCVHPLTQQLNIENCISVTNLCLGLYQLTQALEFLHSKASISHNNVCLFSLYISLNGLWKLGNFECACRYDNLNKKYLSTLKMIRAEECITPEENDPDVIDLKMDEIYALDVYGFGTLIGNLLKVVRLDDSMKNVLSDLQNSLTDEEPQSRPTWSKLLKTQLFQTDYIKAKELLDRLPTVEEIDLNNVVESLSSHLDSLPMEYFDELLIRHLLVPFTFLCPTTRTKLIPRILMPKSERNQSWLSEEIYRQHVIPLIIDLFSYHVTSIRETLLEYFDSYWQLIDRTTLIHLILPQVVYGLKDTNNHICTLTLVALASMIPVLGADVVIGGQRKQIFADKLRKEHGTFPNTMKKPNSVSASPMHTRTSSPAPTTKTKPSRTKSTPPKSVVSDIEPLPSVVTLPIIPPSYTNGHRLSPNSSPEKQSSVVISNGHIDDPIVENEDVNDDRDDGQWSDWENPIESPALIIDDFPPLPSSSQPEQLIRQTSVEKSIESSFKSVKTANISKTKWDPNAPLGSEYEIPPVVAAKKKAAKIETKPVEDDDDFFKDMAPKVETVGLMAQLETMFSVEKDQAQEKERQSTKSARKSSSSTSNKFGIMQQDLGDNQQGFDAGNNWDD